MTRSGPLRVVVLLLKVTGAIVGGIVLLGVALVVWMQYSEASAGRRAVAFCSAVRIGEPLDAVASRAQAEDMMHSDGSEPVPHHLFRYSSWGLHGCDVDVVDGKVTAKRVVSEAFD
jgi:hypothetical protein